MGTGCRGLPPKPGWCTARPRPSEIGGETIKLVNRRSSASGRGAPGCQRPSSPASDCCYRGVYKIGPGCGRAGPSLEWRRRCSPKPAPLLLRLRYATGCVAAAVADRVAQGRLNPARSRLLQCCASNRGRGGASSRCHLPEPAAPRTPEPRCSPAGAIDRRSHISRPRTRRHLGGSGWCHRQRVSRQFFEVSIAASSYLGNDQSRSASKGPMAAECSAP